MRRLLWVASCVGLLASTSCDSGTPQSENTALTGTSDTVSSPDTTGGTDGTDGSDGTDGWDGWDGTDGTDGSDPNPHSGADAATASDDTWGGGWDGTGGTDGWDGTDGTDGWDGTDGGSGDPTVEGCVANCTGRQCGPDGCGGSCGWCSGNDSCQTGTCIAVDGCVPACAGEMVGVDDGCGGVCSGSGFGIGLVPGGAQDASFWRSKVLAGEVPDPSLLPVEGWLTEHGTALPPPETDRLVTLHTFTGLFYDPEQGEPTLAIQLGMNSGLSPETIEEGRFNLCAVIDVSGSMMEDGRLDFVKQGLLQMLDTLDEGDLLSLVTYSTGTNVLMPPTAVTDDNRIHIANAIESLTAGGSTNLSAGLELGYQQVTQNAMDHSLTPRVILLTDGRVNFGVTLEPLILEMSAGYNDVGIGVTTIGVGDDLNFELLHMLATQGGGNFYFVDSAEKLATVFGEEIEYMLTPVADNLQVWFTLPLGFQVEDIYGFEFNEQDGEIHLLGPSPQTTITDGGPSTQPTDPDPEAPDVAVSTLFASKKNGLLMVKVKAPGVSAVEALQGLNITTVHYAYELVDSSATEVWSTEVPVGSLDYSASSGFSYFSGATMQRNFCVLRAALAQKQAATLWHADNLGNIQPAIQQLAFARTFCNGINVQVADPLIDDDVALMEQLMANICGEACVDPAAP